MMQEATGQYGNGRDGLAPGGDILNGGPSAGSSHDHLWGDGGLAPRR